MTKVPVVDAESQAQVRLILSSHQRIVGSGLGGLCLSASFDEVFNSPFVLVSHGVEEDPLFNFGNRRALELWQMDWATFVSLPSRYSAEVGQRSERQRLLKDVQERGFSLNYSGIRASSSGRRFRIQNATVFNLVDSDGLYRGQAATFSEWEYL